MRLGFTGFVYGPFRVCSQPKLYRSNRSLNVSVSGLCLIDGWTEEARQEVVKSIINVQLCIICTRSVKLNTLQNAVVIAQKLTDYAELDRKPLNQTHCRKEYGQEEYIGKGKFIDSRFPHPERRYGNITPAERHSSPPFTNNQIRYYQ